MLFLRPHGPSSSFPTSPASPNHLLQSQRGSTLTEIALVVGTLAVVALAVYLSLDTMTKQANMTHALDDVANFRTAATKWEKHHEEASTRAPTWSELVIFLPDSLHEPVQAATGPALSGLNPWAGDYVMAVSPETPTEWNLAITNVPEDMRDALASQLGKAGGETRVGPCTEPAVGDICARLN